MSDFVSRHYDRERSVFESFFRALHVRNDHDRVFDIFNQISPIHYSSFAHHIDSNHLLLEFVQTSSQPSDGGDEATNRTEERQENDGLIHTT